MVSVSGNNHPLTHLTGRSYDGFYNCKFVARFFYCVADIDTQASKKRQPVTVQQGDAGPSFGVAFALFTQNKTFDTIKK